jgi:hypothetical protein
LSGPEPCGGQPCPAGKYCTLKDECLPLIEAGGKCRFGEHGFQQGLYCAGPQWEAVCVPQVGENGECTPDDPFLDSGETPCLPGLLCPEVQGGPTSRCLAPARLGEACQSPLQCLSWDLTCQISGAAGFGEVTVLPVRRRGLALLRAR